MFAGISSDNKFLIAGSTISSTTFLVFSYSQVSANDDERSYYRSEEILK